MICNIIGAGEGFEDGLKADGFKLGINYWHKELDALMEIHPASHPYHDKLAHHRANADLVGCQLITQDTFNMQRVIDLFETDYFSCSPCWAIAWAILEGDASEIHIWGCSMADRGDHFEKRAGMDYWIGRAEGYGIKVVIHGNSTLLTTEDGLTYGTFQPMKRRYIENAPKEIFARYTEQMVISKILVDN